MTNSGVSVCTFSLAVSRRFTNQAKERQTDFFNIVCWRVLADNCGRYLKKGSKVGVSGTIQNRDYEAKDGTKRYITEIIAEEVEFLDRIGSGAGENAPRSLEPASQASPFDDDVEGFGQVADDDELPF